MVRVFLDASSLFQDCLKDKQKDGIIYWVDSIAFVQESHCEQGYATAGHAWVLAASSQHFGFMMISAISSKRLVRFEFYEGVDRWPRKSLPVALGSAV